IQKLLASPLDKKMAITKRIAEHYSSGGFSQDQQEIVNGLFRNLLADTEKSLRKTLSESIKNTTTVPHDIIAKLAKDIQEVSLPILQFSDVLTDSDLIEIIHSTEEVSKHAVISNRKTVSEDVSEALVDTHNYAVVNTLLKNKGAKVSNGSYKQIVKEHSNKSEVVAALIERESIPVEIVDTIVNTVSDFILDELRDKHKEAYESAHIKEAIEKSRALSSMQVMGMHTSQQEYEQFLQLMGKLNVSKELVPISALCLGYLHVFEMWLARSSGVPLSNIRTLMQDNKGFKALYTRTNLPEHLYEACELLIEVVRELQEDLEGEPIRVSKKIANRMLEQILMKLEEKGEVPNVDYILSLIQHNATTGEED
ncbi:DUF2336 domain-containing protein, partial [Rickettsiales bacterium]|nr:DUF2336 domain-containing protein [Rickettsiales bacterium]